MWGTHVLLCITRLIPQTDVLTLFLKMKKGTSNKYYGSLLACDRLNQNTPKDFNYIVLLVPVNNEQKII